MINCCSATHRHHLLATTPQPLNLLVVLSQPWNGPVAGAAAAGRCEASGNPGPSSLVVMQKSAFEDTRPSDFLMRLAASDLGRSYKSLAVSELAIRAGDVVVDLGCGPGADLAAFAAAVGANGQVIGVDNDPVAAGQARDRTADLPQVDVREADIRTLGIPAASVDRVHTDRVLQHVPEPGTALAQARRILRDGGRAVFAEPDWDTLIIDYPDLATARAYTRYVADHVVRNATVGRQLARLAAEAGFRVGKVIPITAVFRDVQAADQVLGIKRVTARAVDAQYLTQEAASQWLTHLGIQPFFASATLYIVTATAS
jgi:ubiquinone/menaquinone biosynthesis C-methylase UbiE